MITRLSASELMALVLKAGRGAGLPLGACEDVARVAPGLARAARLAEIPVMLQGPFETACLEGSAIVSGHPILVELAVRDLAAARIGCTAPKRWPALAQALEEAAAPIGPFDVTPEVLSALSELAAKTYVPETEASRAGGAGAGLTDND